MAVRHKHPEARKTSHESAHPKRPRSERGSKSIMHHAHRTLSKVAHEAGREAKQVARELGGHAKQRVKGHVVNTSKKQIDKALTLPK